MIMDPARIHAQQEMDDEIMHYVRGMQNTAPIRAQSVASYLKSVRRRRVTEAEVNLRLDYLVDKGWLKTSKEWEPGIGDVEYYEITADGSDILDGVKPRD